MFKTITLIKRRPGLTMEEFIRGYEGAHRLIGERVLAGFAQRYVRRYLHPLPSARPAAGREPDYDVVMEIWYESREVYERAIQRSPDVVAEIARDEARWFDPERIRTFFVEEHESALGA